MHVIACYNIKGGVGKTATAVNLAFSAATAGSKTLLWDLDPQGSASFYFTAAPDQGVKPKKLLKAKDKITRMILPTTCDGLDILPADLSLRHFDAELADAKKAHKKLLKIREALTKEYDTLILDCPPSISHLSDAVFFLADVLAVPVIPTTLSMQSLAHLKTYLKDFSSGPGPSLKPFFSMADRRKKLHRETLTALAGQDGFCATVIPARSRIEQMGTRLTPVGGFAPGSEEAELYVALWEELQAGVYS
jgi:cellulose biosynthesis protein BcsQ